MADFGAHRPNLFTQCLLSFVHGETHCSMDLLSLNLVVFITQSFLLIFSLANQCFCLICPQISLSALSYWALLADGQAQPKKPKIYHKKGSKPADFRRMWTISPCLLDKDQCYAVLDVLRCLWRKCRMEAISSGSQEKVAESSLLSSYSAASRSWTLADLKTGWFVFRFSLLT